MRNLSLRVLLIAALVAPLFLGVTPAVAQSDDFVPSSGVIRFGFVQPWGGTVHYRLPINLRTVIHTLWNEKLPELNAMVVQGSEEERGSLYDQRSRLSASDKAQLLVKQVGDTLSLRYEVRDNRFNASEDIDCDIIIIDVCPDPSFEVKYKLTLELSGTVNDLAQPLTVSDGQARVSDADVSGDGLYSEIILFIGEVLFGAESKIERALNRITLPLTGEINAALVPNVSRLTRYIPPGYLSLASSVDAGGTISLCAKLDPTEHCDFPDSSTQPVFTFDPVLTSAAALRAADVGEWYRDAVQVALSTSGGSGGPIRTFYRMGNGPDVEADGPVTIDQDGIHLLSYYSIDSTGEREPDQTQTIKFDRTAPAVDLALGRAPDAASGWYNQPTEARVAVSDPLSGVGSGQLEVRRDGALITSQQLVGNSFTAVPISEDGRYQITVTVADQIGNTATSAYTVNLDQQAPGLAVEVAPAGLGLVAAATDAGSGVARVEMSLDGGQTWEPASTPLPLTGGLRIRATDVADNAVEIGAAIRSPGDKGQWLLRAVRGRVGSEDLPADHGVVAGLRAHQQSVPVAPGQTLTVSADVLASDPTVGPSLWVIWLDRNLRRIDDPNTMAAPGFTGRIERALRAPEGAAYAHVHVRGVGVGQIWLDTIAVRDADGRNLLPDGDFSAGLGETWGEARWRSGIGTIGIKPFGPEANPALHLDLRPTWTSAEARLLRSDNPLTTARQQLRPSAAFTVKPAGHYELMLAAMGVELDQLEMQLTFYNGEGVALSTVPAAPVTGTFGWMWLRLNAEAPPEAATARPTVTLKGRGVVALDSVLLIER